MTTSNEQNIRNLVDNAKEFLDPLENLIERTKLDSSAPFESTVILALSTLKAHDTAGFESLRAKLKGAGCRVTALDDELKKLGGESSSTSEKQADVLLNLAVDAQLFHCPDGNTFAEIKVNSHTETWPVRSKAIRLWLQKKYYEAKDGAPGREAMESALNVLEARAIFDGPEKKVFLRVGSQSGKFYLDLCDDRWRAVEIDRDGWRILDEPPVNFRRASGSESLPDPVMGGRIETLKNSLNVKQHQDFLIAVSWLLAVLRDNGPYPVLVLSGEQGSAKSTFSAVLRSLLDPNSAPLRALPREDRDLFIAAKNGHVLAFDNISGLPTWVSDTLCRLATGAGFAVRQLYTDQDEVLFRASRPVILNGIEDIVARPDLADRAIFLNLEPISESERRPESEFWAEFESNKPKILGALLDGVSHGLKNLPNTQLDSMPRMADFALWATACETSYWHEGAFMEAYEVNRVDAISNVIDGDPVASAVKTFMQDKTRWRGSATDLLEQLEKIVGDKISRSSVWPKSARALSGRLTRAATFLRKIGIDVDRGKAGRGAERSRTIQIFRVSDSIQKIASTSSPIDFDSKEDAFPLLIGDAGDEKYEPIQPGEKEGPFKEGLNK